jgi:hypothetical protein
MSLPRIKTTKQESTTREAGIVHHVMMGLIALVLVAAVGVAVLRIKSKSNVDANAYSYGTLALKSCDNGCTYTYICKSFINGGYGQLWAIRSKLVNSSTTQLYANLVNTRAGGGRTSLTSPGVNTTVYGSTIYLSIPLGDRLNTYYTSTNGTAVTSSRAIDAINIAGC